MLLSVLLSLLLNLLLSVLLSLLLEIVPRIAATCNFAVRNLQQAERCLVLPLSVVRQQHSARCHLGSPESIDVPRSINRHDCESTLNIDHVEKI